MCFPQSNFSACQIPDLVQKRKWKQIWSGSIPQSSSNSLDTVVTLESVLFFGGLASSVPTVVDTEAGSWVALDSCAWITVSHHMHASSFSSGGIRPLEESRSMSISLKRRHLMVYHRQQQHPYLRYRRFWHEALSSGHSHGLVGVSVFLLLLTL